MNLLKSLAGTIALTLKRLYDIMATYLLFWVLYLAASAVGFHFAFEWLWQYLGVANPELVWAEISAGLPVDVATTKLATVLGLHTALFVLIRRPIASLQPMVEKMFDATAEFFDRITTERWSLRLFGESMFTGVVSALLIPFVIQPTLVRGWDALAWEARATNLVNGTAVLDLPDSVVGYYRRLTAEAVVVDEGVSADELQSVFAEAAAAQQVEEEQVELTTVHQPAPPVVAGVVRPQHQPMVLQTPASKQPVMDRWDGQIREAVEDDDELFAYVKAFMYVESAGRQYAVSRTGCAGLMQFCAGTARSQPYRAVFGTGNVYACGCRGGACSIPKSTQVALESGDADQVNAQEANFPCELTDARFDPDKAIGAGSMYVGRLHRAYGGNIYLMYIGYNSGPGVANRVFRALEQNPTASIEEIDQHLTSALQPYYGASSARRARSLVNVHLPKIESAHLRYGGQATEHGAYSMLSPISASCEFSMAMPVGETLL